MRKAIYEGYTVTEEGIVMDAFGFEVTPYIDRHGYAYVKLAGITSPQRLNRVVWSAFNGPIEGTLQVDHIDNNRLNNNINNLQLMTPSENSIKARANSTADRSRKEIVQYTLDGNEVASFKTATEAERLTADGIKANHRRISECARGLRDTHRGYIWKYRNYEV